MAFTPDFLTGFEFGQAYDWSGEIHYKVTGAIADAQAKTGSYSVRDWAGFKCPVARDEFYLAVWAYPGIASRIKFAEDIEGDPDLIYLRYEGSLRRWNAYRGDDVLLASGSVSTREATWQHVQMHVKLADAGGIVQTYIDGIPDIDFTGDTKPGDAATMEYIWLGDNFARYWDDLFLGTGGWPGDCRVEGLQPNADTATKNWTRSAGADNYALVDEVPPSTADYVYCTTDVADLYELSDWDDIDKTPIGVIEWAYAKKDSAIADDKIRLQMTDGVNTIDGR